MPTSPHLSEDDGDRPSGFPGSTSLKHTQTIMGSKSGIMGLRVSGSRRSSTLHRASGTPPSKVQFIPRFKGAAEMEARRRLRMFARRGPGKAGMRQPQTAHTANLDLSSSSSSSSADTIDENDFDEMSGNDSGDESDDEFDP